MLNIFLQILLLLLFGFLFIFFAMEFYNILFRGYAPFIVTRKKVIAKILSELDIREGAKIYELGCGQAGFLRALRKKFPRSELIGVEYQLLPYLIGGMQSALTNSKIKFKKKNIFKLNLRDADLIYCYLNPKTMARLEGKFKAECRPGTEVISYQFPLPNKQPEKVVIGPSEKDKVYFYKI